MATVTVKVTARDENEELLYYQVEAPACIADNLEILMLLAYGLLYKNEWIPNSLYSAVIFVDGEMVNAIERL